MKASVWVLIAGTVISAAGCKKDEPRPGAVDTSDPNKVLGTMTPPPKGGKDPTALGAMGGGPKK